MFQFVGQKENAIGIYYTAALIQLCLAVITFFFTRRYDKQQFMTHQFRQRKASQVSMTTTESMQNAVKDICKVFRINFLECVGFFTM